MDDFNKIPIIVKSTTKMFNDINYDKTHTKYRVLPDKTTEVFTRHFISNPTTDDGHKRLLTFIDYIYNTINFKVLTNVNEKLKEKGFKTMGNEQIFLMFKGGNNLVLLQDIFDRITESSQIRTNALPTKITSNIKISDNDFTINIITESDLRYNQIYFCVKELLTISLCEICDMFNGFLNNMELMKNTKSVPAMDLTKHEMDIVRGQDLLIQFFPFTNDYSKQDTNKLKELESLPFNDCNNTNLLIVASYIMSCYQNYDCGTINGRIKQLLAYKLTYFFDNIYMDKEAFKEELAMEINKMILPDNLFYAIKGDEILHYKVAQPIKSKNIDLTSAENTMIYKSNVIEDGRLGTVMKSYLPSTIGKNAHYVSINGAIFNNMAKIGHLVDFDLLRIKCNVTVNQPKTFYKYTQSVEEEFDPNGIFIPSEFKIPSEFVDVSIGKFSHATTVDIREEYYKNPKRFIDSHLYEYKNTNPIAFRVFVMYGSEYIVEDLMITLFKQGTYTPLFDNKYNKRVVRLFYFYCMFIVLRDKGTRNLCEILGNVKREFQIISSALKTGNGTTITPTPSFNSTFYSVPFNFDALVNYCLGKPIFSFVDVKPEYELLKPLLNFVLAFKTIFETNFEYIVQFSQQYNDLYNIIDTSDANEIFASFSGFIGECSEIVDSCINIFCNSSLSAENQVYGIDSLNGEEKRTLVKTELEGATKYTYMSNGKELFEFTVPEMKEFPNDITKCVIKCRSGDDEVCCDDKNKKYAEILHEFNRLENGSVKKEEMRKVLKTFFENK